MKKLTFLTSVVLFTTAAAFAADSDPGYGPRPGTAGSVDSDTGVVRSRRSGSDASFYKPTQRYYGKGYTVAYRFVRADARSARTRSSSPDFDSATYRISTQSATTFVGESPRVTHYYGGKKSSSVRPAQRDTAPRSIVTQPSTPVKDLPPIAEGPDKK
jgi:hypothetical protein